MTSSGRKPDAAGAARQLDLRAFRSRGDRMRQEYHEQRKNDP
jgi:hypothetical protein